MATNNDHILRAMLRNDFHSFNLKACEHFMGGSFVPAPYIEVLSDVAQRVSNGELKRVLITLPPRCLKSTIFSVNLVAWWLGRHPQTKFMTVSYDQGLASSLLRQTRELMRTPWYQDAFPSLKIGRKDTETEFETTSYGGRRAISMMGAATGHGARVIIVDDPQKAQDITSEVVRAQSRESFNNLMTRQDDKTNTAVIVIMQRLHEDDLAAHVLESEGWHHTNLPAIHDKDFEYQTLSGNTISFKEGELLHPTRDTVESLAQLEKDIGRMRFSAQYLQKPTPQGGGIFKREWFKEYQSLPEDVYGHYVQSWDTAYGDDSGSDYSVCTTWLVVRPDIKTSAQQFYLVDVFRGRLDFPALRKMIIAQAKKYSPREILIEDTGSGKSFVQDIKANKPQDMYLRIIPIRPEGSKESRAYTATVPMERGDVFFPANGEFMEQVKAELLGFPNTRYDDTVDSTTQFINHLMQWKRLRIR